MLKKKEGDIHVEIDREFAKMLKDSTKPKILIVTPEVTELPEGMGNAAHLVTAKGGGMGDISASLIHYLNENSVYELHVALPKYDNRIKGVSKITDQEIDRLSIILSGKGIHLVNDSAFSYLDDPYQEHKVHSRLRRCFALQRYVINDLMDLIQPDVVHCNDWMTSLIPCAARAKGVKSLFTLHNIFTEHQTLKDIELSGLKPRDFAQYLFFEVFPENILANWQLYFTTNPVDFTASGIMACDWFNTVSPTFLEELVQNIFSDIVPASIYEAIRDKVAQGRASGILNAPNDKIDPRILPNIVNFGTSSVMEKKPLNKIAFQEAVGLPVEPNVPLFFWPNRLYYQKSPDLLLDMADFLIHKYQMQIAVVGNGDRAMEEKLRALDRRYRNIAYRPFKENLSNLGKAGADFILMPSRYEPCGLPQMEVPRFGTLPVVRSTGGLRDTITQLDFVSGKGNGFLFRDINRESLEASIKEALMFYAQPASVRKRNLQRIMKESMERFNLKITAGEYMDVYDRLIYEKKNG